MTRRIFEVNKKESRKRRCRRLIWLLGISLLILLAIVIVLLAIFLPRYLMPVQVRGCQKRSYDLDSFVCVCTADYCDEIEETGNLGANELVYFLTSRDEHRLKRFSVNPDKEVEDENDFEIHLNESETFQSVMGFGGAFSDAVGINLKSLNPKAREQLLKQYFDKNEGIRYTIGRVPIASTDFSTRVYSYVDTANDFEMKSFALAVEDIEYKIPNILAAQKMANEHFRLYASPWSAPWWMKESGTMYNGGPMKGNVVGGNDTYYRAYAKYFRLFFEEYAKRNVNFWAMTMENEPSNAKSPWWQAQLFEPEKQRQFAYHLLSPELKKSKVTKDLIIMAHDDQRDRIVEDARKYYGDPKESSAIAGLAVHWYSFDSYAPLQAAHELNPKKFMLGSEASCGDQANGEFRGPQLGNWTRGWSYGHDILNDMANWVGGWTDWNLCLNLNGGPNWFGNTIDAAIIVNSTAQEFYKQPLFYFLGHFSRFIPVNSVRISSKLYNIYGYEVEPVDGFFIKDLGQLEHIAFRTPDGNLVLVLINGDAANEKLVKVRNGNRQWSIPMPTDSIATAILKPTK